MDEKRRHKRVTVEGVYGNVVFASKAEIINISLGGAAIQVDTNLKIGKEYNIRLEGKDKHVEIKGITVWSVLSESKKGPHGDVIPIYHTGIKFINALTDKSAELVDFIESHKIKGTEDRLRGIRFKVQTNEKAIVDYSFGYRVKFISLSGMFIETLQIFKPEDRLPMEIALKNGSIIRFVGRVVSCTEIADKHPIHYNIGVEFVEMSDEDKLKLEEFVRSVSN
ncbi:MAG: PilZ domain-containing protein [Nitrospirae bacterium]|nr:MAG: PilZ domain-containing protein [Nitrospirota bacterium]